MIEVLANAVKMPATPTLDGYDDSPPVCMGCGAELTLLPLEADRRHNIMDCLYVLRTKIIRLEAWKVDVAVP